MKNFITTIDNLYKKYTNQRTGVYRKNAIRPGKDWKIIVFGIFFITFCSFLVHGFIYFRVKDSSWWQDDVANNMYQKKVNTMLLDDILNNFDKRQTEIDSIKSNNSSPQDPSL
ncbi:MAG: hypothetical protein ACYCZW_03520 [Minisyncoccota bacterium]